MPTKTAKSLKVACPECHEAETVTIDLNDLSACCCGSCSAEFSPAEALAKALEMVARWQAVVTWIAAAPVE